MCDAFDVMVWGGVSKLKGIISFMELLYGADATEYFEFRDRVLFFLFSFRFFLLFIRLFISVLRIIIKNIL